MYRHIYNRGLDSRGAKQRGRTGIGTRGGAGGSSLTYRGHLEPWRDGLKTLNPFLPDKIWEGSPGWKFSDRVTRRVFQRPVPGKPGNRRNGQGRSGSLDPHGKQ